MLKIPPSAAPFAFSRIFIRQSMPSEMYVNERRWVPPSTSLIGSPYRMLWRNCVSTRLEPSLGESMSSRWARSS